MIDLGLSQVDATLYTALRDLTVPEAESKELARLDVFGGTPMLSWIAGLRATAITMTGQSTNLDWGTLPDPWAAIGPAVAAANGAGYDVALINTIGGYTPEIQSAIITSIGSVMTLNAVADEQHELSIKGASNPSRAAAVASVARYLDPIDADLATTIRRLLAGSAPAEKKLKEAGEHLIDWLVEHGRFVQVPSTGDRYYLYRDKRRLLTLDTDRWRAWLYLLSMVNPASKHYKYLEADCKTASYDGERAEVVKLAHWDGNYLRVSDFAGNAHRLDGESIELEPNGDGPALFGDSPMWTPYLADLNSDLSTLNWWLGLGNFEEPSEQHRLALLAYVCAIFLTELCPTRPILLIRGEAGSGKSMLLRILLRLLFGPSGEVSGVPDKADGFTAMAASNHFFVLDNLDSPTDWLREKLARLSTGGVDQYRKLWTNNESGTIVYRSWLAVTARTPDALRRDDLADRLLIIPTVRLTTRKREGAFLAEAMNRRSLFWGDLLQILNRVVSEIRTNGLPTTSDIRMADFEAIGRVAARVVGKEDVWNELVKTWMTSQTAFILEDSTIADALDEWLKDPTHGGTWITTRRLYTECQFALFGVDRPDSTWPRSARSFGRQLQILRRSLASDFDIEWSDKGRHTMYRIDVKH